MSGYEVEHGIPTTTESKPEHTPRRPDLSSFFSTLELVDTSDAQARNNEHALPQPENTAAAFRLLANAFEMMSENENDLLSSMIDHLRQNADDPPSELKGVPNSFLDQLERVSKKSLKPTDTCPICVNPFLDVRLPCHVDHRFDLDCISPWLKLNSTCPLDRKELLKKKSPPPPPVDDEEEDYDDMFA